MLSRRDVAAACVGAVAMVAAAQVVHGRAEIMGSRIFDWTTFKVEPTATGEVRHIVQTPTATLDELEIHITTLKPGVASHAPHQHPAEELIIVKEGTVEALVNGEMKRVGPGSIIFQASNQLHAIKNVGTGPATYHVVQWKTPATTALTPK